MIKFSRIDFFPKRHELDINLIKNLISDIIVDINFKLNFMIEDISSLELIRENSVVFIESILSLNHYNQENICLITSKEDVFKFYNDKYSIILVNDINKAYRIISNNLFFHDDNLEFYDEFKNINGSYISNYSEISDNVQIGKNCTIGRGVKISKGSIIKNNVVLKNCIISNNVTICDNTTIGSTGFGFDLKDMGSDNILPQIGIVYIDDNVHIGANCTIDRAKIDITYIGKNSMIDNLVHIAHNVYIGNNACIAAQSAISGSTKIGNNLIAGGQSGFAGHILIGDNVIVAAKSGVTKNINSNSTIAGFPAIDIKEWKKNIIRNKKNGH